MVKKKILKLKRPYLIILKVISVVLVFVLGIFIFYRHEINEIKALDYSELASRNILFSWKKDYVMSIGKNKTLNAAFESKYLKEKNLDNYAKIEYQEQEHLIKNINILLNKGYRVDEISLILAHGDDQEVSDFTKRDKIKYLEEFYTIDYAKLKYYDRYVNYSYETGEDEETTVLSVNLNMDKNDYEDAVEVKDFSYDMLVNKHRYLDEKYEPNLVVIDEKYAAEKGMKAERAAVNAFIKMYNAAQSEGLGLVINSSYRSYQDQVEIMETYRDLYGDAYVEKYVAKPGFSEHQTGLCFDIGSQTTSIFANSKEYVWMQDNAYKYGFIYRFPKKYENITGFRNEPWHYRYVGEKIAKKIYEDDITLEEYFALYLDN